MDHTAPATTAEPEPTGAVGIVHAAIPGRVRLLVRGLRQSAALKARLEQGLARWGDVQAAWPSTDTGNLLVLHDPAVPPEQVAARVARLVASPLVASPLVASPLASPPQVASPVASSPGAVPEAADECAWHQLEVPRVAAELGTSLEQGLRTELAEHRAAIIGPNRIATPPGRSRLEIAAAQLRPLPVLLLAAAGAASLLTGGLLDAVAIFGVIALNAGIGYAVESRSEQTIRLLGSPPATRVRVLRDGARQEIAADRVVPGDVILLARGDTVPADARLCQVHDLFTDEATLTGESLPVRKQAEAAPPGMVALADRRNMVYRGTVATSGTAMAIVVATGAQTELGRIQRLLSTSVRPPTPMEQELDQLGRRLSWLSVGLAGAVAVIGLLRGLGMAAVLRSTAALAIAAIPEGLPTVASTTLARGVEQMRRRGLLVRRLDAVETLGAVQVLCFDKTGTLTFNRMQAASVALSAAGQAVAPEALRPAAEDLVLHRLLDIAVLCSEVSIDPADGSLTGSETETALVRLAQACGVDPAAIRRQQPMTAVRHRSEAYRFMATTHRLPDGRALTAVKGDPLDVLALCDGQLQGQDVVPLRPNDRQAVRQANAAMAGRALRVLGFAFRVEDNGDTALGKLVWVGLVGLADAVRPSAGPLMRTLRQAGIHPLVLTGDQVATARAVADQLGLNGHGGSVVVDSAELAGMAPEMIVAAARRAHVFARVSPAEKLRIVQALQAAGIITGMIGDGFNDSPALKAANVGIAIGGAGAEAAREAAQIVMQTDDLGAIAGAIAQGRAAHANVRRATGYLVGTNLSEIGYVIAGTAAGSAEPLSAAQLLWINIVSDVLPGVGLSAEPPDASVLQRPPRSRAHTVLGRADLPRLAMEGGVIAAGAMASSAWGVLRHGPGPQARSMGFAALVLGQLLHTLNRRDPERRGGNPTLVGALALSFGAQVVALLMPGLRDVLGIAPLGPADVAVTLAGGVLPFAALRLARADHSAALAGASASAPPLRSTASST